MKILGIDPGIAITGFGILQLNEAGDPELVRYGVIDSTAVRETSSRLRFLFDALQELLVTEKPDYCALEKLYFSKNITTGMRVSEARGVIELCLAKNNVPVGEYTPNEVKQSVTSYGNAAKKQVQEMVKVMLAMESIPKPDDAADALAIALCHISHLRYERKISEVEA